MTYKQQLDKVLKELSKGKPLSISKFCIEQFPKNTGKESDDIFNELIEENFIYETDFPAKSYKLTRKGKLFKGYVCNDRIKSVNTFFKVMSSVFVTLGAFSAIVVAYFEYIKFTERESEQILNKTDSTSVTSKHKLNNKSNTTDFTK